MATAARLNWKQIHEEAGAIFDRLRYFYFPEPDSRIPMTLTLMGYAAGLRDYAIAHRTDLLGLWKSLREQPLLLDLLLGLIAELPLVTEASLEAMARDYAASVHAAIPTAESFKEDWTSVEDYLVIDDGMIESLGTAFELERFLVANPWLLALLILRRSGKLSLVRPVTETVPVGGERVHG